MSSSDAFTMCEIELIRSTLPRSIAASKPSAGRTFISCESVKLSALKNSLAHASMTLLPGPRAIVRQPNCKALALISESLAALGNSSFVKFQSAVPST